MAYYSQNDEERIILNYFGGFKGNLCDIGANDGITFSNSLALLEKGWRGHLLEPDKRAYSEMLSFYDSKKLLPRALCLNLGIGVYNAKQATFHQAGPHIPNDIGLLSTFEQSSMARWPNVEFKKSKAELITWEEFQKQYDPPDFDFMTIDAEGMDVEILTQIDLSKTHLVCVEWNLHPGTQSQIDTYCKIFKMKKIYQTPENLIYGK